MRLAHTEPGSGIGDAKGRPPRLQHPLVPGLCQYLQGQVYRPYRFPARLRVERFYRRRTHHQPMARRRPQTVRIRHPENSHPLRGIPHPPGASGRAAFLFLHLGGDLRPIHPRLPFPSRPHPQPGAGPERPLLHPPPEPPFGTVSPGRRSSSTCPRSGKSARNACR